MIKIVVNRAENKIFTEEMQQMKKTIIGITFITIGTAICLSIIELASNLINTIDVWRGTKLWFAIFGARDLREEPSLFLGTPFILGGILFFLGLIMLIVEYLNLFDKNEK